MVSQPGRGENPFWYLLINLSPNAPFLWLRVFLDSLLLCLLQPNVMHLTVRAGGMKIKIQQWTDWASLDSLWRRYIMVVGVCSQAMMCMGTPLVSAALWPWMFYITSLSLPMFSNFPIILLPQQESTIECFATLTHEIFPIHALNLSPFIGQYILSSTVI